MSDKKPDKKADKKGGKDAKAPKASGKKGGGALLWIGIFIDGAVVLPVTIIAVPGLIPGLVMWLTDRSRGRNLLVAAGTMNLAGVMAVALNLLRKTSLFNFNESIPYAIQLLYDPANWIVMWGAAGIGYALFKIIPPLVAQALATAAAFRAQKLKKNQEELKRLWGEEVKG